MSPARKQNDSLSGIVKVVAVVVIVCLGLWGCARKPVRAVGSSDRISVLESRCQKLEQDCRTMTQARDKARKELATLEDEVARWQKEASEKDSLFKECERLRQQIKASFVVRDKLQKQLAERTSERDDLLAQMAQRMNERETLINRCEKLRKGLQQLLTQDDNPTSPIGPSVPTSGPALNTQS